MSHKNFEPGASRLQKSETVFFELIFPVKRPKSMLKIDFGKCLYSTGVILYTVYEKVPIEDGMYQRSIRERDDTCADRAHVRSRW
jgi:hypothetical protein